MARCLTVVLFVSFVGCGSSTESNADPPSDDVASGKADSVGDPGFELDPIQTEAECKRLRTGGECVKTVVRWCVGGTIFRRDCKKTGDVCATWGDLVKNSACEKPAGR